LGANVISWPAAARSAFTVARKPVADDAMLNDRIDQRRAVLAAAVMFVLCMAAALHRPLFHDEASTLEFCGGSLQYMWQMVRQDVHPPGYFVLAWALLKLPGAGLMALRVFSALAMGAAAGVFVTALQRWMGRQLPWALVALVALCPFMVLCGYFARYYSLVALLWAGVFWLSAEVCGVARRRRVAAGIGVLLGVTFLINYAGAMLTGLSLLPVLWVLARRRDWRSLAWVIIPPAIVAMLWSPILLDQLRQNLGDRTGTGISMLKPAKVAGVLGWNCIVGDALPPWNPLGLAGLLVAVAAFVVMWAFVIKRPNSPVRLPLLMATLLAVGGIIIGYALFAGTSYIFLPARVAAVGFSWLIIVCMAASPHPWVKWCQWSIVAVHLVGSAALLFTPWSMNWAYRIPAHDIARLIEHSANGHPGTLLYLPVKSLRNVDYTLKHEHPGLESGGVIIKNPRVDDLQLTTATRSIILREAARDNWPPSAAISDAAVHDPAGRWTLIASFPFVPEDAAAQWVKRRLTGRDVETFKLRLDVWERVPAGSTTSAN